MLSTVVNAVRRWEPGIYPDLPLQWGYNPPGFYATPPSMYTAKGVIRGEV